jgi:hypothetical protein
MEQLTETIRNAFHHRRSVGQTVQRGLAKRPYQLAGFAGLVGGARELKKKLLKSPLRMRFSPEAGISDIGCQATPSA